MDATEAMSAIIDDPQFSFEVIRKLLPNLERAHLEGSMRSTIAEHIEQDGEPLEGDTLQAFTNAMVESFYDLEAAIS